MLQRYGKKQIAVNANEWTPISAVLTCDFFSIRCTTSDLLIRTDVDDALTEDVISQGTQEGVTTGSGSTAFVASGIVGQAAMNPRFPIGSILCYIKSVAPTAIVRLTWVL